jgi:hypothetical protein
MGRGEGCSLPSPRHSLRPRAASRRNWTKKSGAGSTGNEMAYKIKKRWTIIAFFERINGRLHLGSS